MTRTEQIDVFDEQGIKKILLKIINYQEITGINGKYEIDMLPQYFTENGDTVNERNGVFTIVKTGEIFKL